MDRLAFALAGIWFWLTRRRRIEVYTEAARTLELAHAYLLHDFASRASTSDRGSLLPHQAEALTLLERHATTTYMTVTRIADFGRCRRFVAEELRRLNTAPVIAAATPRVVKAPIPIRLPAAVRVRYRLPRAADFPALARFLHTESSGALWPARAIDSAKTQAPLKAA